MSTTTEPSATPEFQEPRATVPDLRRFEMGAAVLCEDGHCGYLGRLVVDPLSRTVTHLIVEPRHRHARARLVPIALVDTESEELRVRCTAAVLRALQHARETEFLPAGDAPSIPYPVGGLGEVTMLPWAHYASARKGHMHECIPLGDVEIRRGEHLHAIDGAVGRVEGLVVDQNGAFVTHVLLQEGHLWGARQVTVPIDAVSRIDGEGVHVSLTKHQIDALPGIELAANVRRNP